MTFSKRPENQNQHILCDLHFSSEDCCILWAMASSVGVTWFLNRNTYRKWPTIPVSFSIKDGDCGSIWDLLRKVKIRSQACSKLGCLGKGRHRRRVEDAACSPSLPIQVKQWMEMTHLQFASSFRSINRTLLKPVSRSPLEQHSRMKQYPGLLGLHFYALLQDYKYSS